MNKEKIRRGLISFIKGTKLSDQEFSEKIGVSRATVWRWKNDTLPGVDTLVLIANKFSVSLDTVVGRRC